MDSSCLDLEFFDLTNASDEEIKEIRSILSDTGSNGCVELPWEIPLSFPETAVEEKLDSEQCEKLNVTPSSTTSSAPLGGVVGQALLYAPPQQQQQPVPSALSAPPTQLNVQASEVMPPMEAVVPQMPPISAASAVGPHYPAPYLVPRTLPYLRAYPHVGVPLFTCSLPGDLTHVPSPYTPFLPLATPLSAVAQPRLDKPAVDKENGDIRQKNKITSDRQFYHHRSRKKNLSSSSYYQSPDFVQGVDAYQDSSTHEDQSLAPAGVTAERLPAVPSSLPVVPVPMPPSTFSVTSGALPMPSYPPGLHPIHYSPQISGPQAPTTPLYYVPVFSPHYGSYIPSASGHMMLPMGSVTVAASSVHQGTDSACSVSVSNEVTEDVTKSTESLAASIESNEKSENSSLPIKPDAEVTAENEEADIKVTEECNETSIEDVVQDKIDHVIDSHLEDDSDAVTESVAHASPEVDACCDERSERNLPHKMYNDSSRCWADLFKKQYPEVNGLDRRPSEQSPVNDSNLSKEINGKLYSVPNSDSVL